MDGSGLMLAAAGGMTLFWGGTANRWMVAGAV